MNIVIAGGGFAGVKTALELSRRGLNNITLISDEPYFLHHATLYATATGKDMAESVIPLAALFAGNKAVKVVQDTLVSIDPERRLMIGAKQHYKYDQAVLALGSVTTFFGIKGMQQHAFGIKSLEEITKFRAHMHDEIVAKRFDKEYFVIGAGPTGVELAGALHEYLQALMAQNGITNRRTRVTLVEAAPRIVPKMSATAAKIIGKRLKKMGIRVLVNHKVEALTDDTIKIDGKVIETQTAIWTSGVANNPFFAAHEHIFHLAPNGRVNVSPRLEALPGIYVLGDNNTVTHSGMAWPALYQAKYAAKRIARRAKKLPTFAFQSHSVMCGLPVGTGWGYVEWQGVYVAGPLGAWIRRRMELYGYKQLAPAPVARALWRAHDIPDVRTLV